MLFGSRLPFDKFGPTAKQRNDRNRFRTEPLFRLFVLHRSFSGDDLLLDLLDLFNQLVDEQLLTVGADDDLLLAIEVNVGQRRARRDVEVVAAKEGPAGVETVLGDVLERNEALEG